jgi:hypothetical protein
LNRTDGREEIESVCPDAAEQQCLPVETGDQMASHEVPPSNSREAIDEEGLGALVSRAAMIGVTAPGAG